MFVILKHTYAHKQITFTTHQDLLPSPYQNNCNISNTKPKIIVFFAPNTLQQQQRRNREYIRKFCLHER